MHYIFSLKGHADKVIEMPEPSFAWQKYTIHADKGKAEALRDTGKWGKEGM